MLLTIAEKFSNIWCKCWSCNARNCSRIFVILTLILDLFNLNEEKVCSHLYVEARNDIVFPKSLKFLHLESCNKQSTKKSAHFTDKISLLVHYHSASRFQLKTIRKGQVNSSISFSTCSTSLNRLQISSRSLLGMLYLRTALELTSILCRVGNCVHVFSVTSLKQEQGLYRCM